MGQGLQVHTQNSHLGVLVDMEATCHLRVVPGGLLGIMEQTWAQLCLQSPGHPEAWEAWEAWE